MKVSVYEVVMHDGTGGKVMVPSRNGISCDDYASELRKEEGVKQASWEYNMWISSPIAAPMLIEKVKFFRGYKD